MSRAVKLIFEVNPRLSEGSSGRACHSRMVDVSKGLCMMSTDHPLALVSIRRGAFSINNYGLASGIAWPRQHLTQKLVKSALKNLHMCCKNETEKRRQLSAKLAFRMFISLSDGLTNRP